MLSTFLAQPNVLAILDLSNTETPLELLFPALVRGCTTALTHLNLSRNPFSSSKKARDVPPAFKQFFAATLAMQYLNMSYCKIPPDALKNLLLGTVYFYWDKFQGSSNKPKSDDSLFKRLYIKILSTNSSHSHLFC